MEKIMPIKYNFIDFLIKFYFIDFLLKYNQKCHENQRQLEKKDSVDDFDFSVLNHLFLSHIIYKSATSYYFKSDNCSQHTVTDNPEPKTSEAQIQQLG